MKVEIEFPRVNYIKELADAGERAAELAANDPTMSDHHATLLHLGMVQEMFRRLACDFNRLVTKYTAKVEPDADQRTDRQIDMIARAMARQAVPMCAGVALDEALDAEGDIRDDGTADYVLPDDMDELADRVAKHVA